MQFAVLLKLEKLICKVLFLNSLDNIKGIKVNKQFVDLLESVNLSDYDDMDRNQIVLMKKIMKQISGDKTKIIFKREWKNKDSKYIINWATGKALEF